MRASIFLSPFSLYKIGTAAFLIAQNLFFSSSSIARKLLLESLSSSKIFLAVFALSSASDFS